MSLTVGERNEREQLWRHRRKQQPLLIHSTVRKRAKRMPDTTVETTPLNHVTLPTTIQIWTGLPFNNQMQWSGTWMVAWNPEWKGQNKLRSNHWIWLFLPFEYWIAKVSKIPNFWTSGVLNSGDLKSNQLKLRNIWNPVFLKVGFQMVQFTKGQASAMAIVPTIQQLDHSKSEHFYPDFKWSLAGR